MDGGLKVMMTSSPKPTSQETTDATTLTLNAHQLMMNQILRDAACNTQIPTAEDVSLNLLLELLSTLDQLSLSVDASQINQLMTKMRHQTMLKMTLLKDLLPQLLRSWENGMMTKRTTPKKMQGMMI